MEYFSCLQIEELLYDKMGHESKTFLAFFLNIWLADMSLYLVTAVSAVSVVFNFWCFEHGNKRVRKILVKSSNREKKFILRKKPTIAELHFADDSIKATTQHYFREKFFYFLMIKSETLLGRNDWKVSWIHLEVAILMGFADCGNSYGIFNGRNRK